MNITEEEWMDMRAKAKLYLLAAADGFKDENMGEEAPMVFALTMLEMGTVAHITLMAHVGHDQDESVAITKEAFEQLIIGLEKDAPKPH